jgi:hypothetical protein
VLQLRFVVEIGGEVALWRYCSKNNEVSSVMVFSSLQQLHRDAETSVESGTLNIAHISAIPCHLSLLSWMNTGSA